MCGRYALFDDADIAEIENILKQVQNNINGTKVKTGEIKPTNIVPILLANEGIKITAMKWGFPKWDSKGVIINARSETAARKKSFATPLRVSRCVIPTTGFYEWDENKNKYLFTYDDGPVMYLAGIYNSFKKDDTRYQAFTIFTKQANRTIEDIHNRMPVVLYKNEIEDFIEDKTFCDYAFNRNDIILNREIEQTDKQVSLFDNSQ